MNYEPMTYKAVKLDPLEGETEYPEEEAFTRCIIKCLDKKRLSFAPGHTELKPEGPLVAGGIYNLCFFYWPDEIQLNKGCKIKFSIPRTWTQPHTEKGLPGCVQASTSSDAAIELFFSHNENLQWWITVKVIKGVIPQNGFIKIDYKAVTIQRFPQNTWNNFRNSLRVILDLHGDKNYSIVPAVKTQKPIIVAAPASRFNVAATSVVSPLENIRLKFCAIDPNNNYAYPYPTGKIFIADSRDPFSAIAEINLDLSKKGHGEIEIKASAKEKIKKFIVFNKKNNLQGETAPIRVKKGLLSVYFGDIHAKTGLTDGLNTPEEYFIHVRDVACLDFAAIADHNSCEASRIEGPFRRSLSDRAYEEIKNACEKFNCAGEFVTLHGFEQNKIDGFPGHRNIYFKSIPRKIFCGSTLEELYAYLKGKEALVIPHHTIIWNTKVHLDDSKFSRLIEIYSMHCSSERKNSPINNPGTTRNKAETGISAQEVLEQGYRVGFIAASDNHNGAPGLSAAPSRFTNLCYQGGLAAVFAPELTREAIFDSLYARHCYATTGARIYLEFKINGKVMGSELKVSSGSCLKIEVFCLGTTQIAKVELLKNNNIIYEIQDGFSDIVEFTKEDKVHQNSWYYIRVIQIDRNIAWSSPIWIDI